MDQESIFSEALKKNTLEERARFLAQACGDNTELRIEVEALLSAHDDAGSFLRKPPEELAATFNSDESLSNDDSDDAWRKLLKPSNSADCIGTLGSYEIIELVGQGGMGVVLRARDAKLKRTVAIKLLAPELAANAMAVRRFLREARAAAAVSHNHVVTIYAIDEDSRPPLIAMEYVDGISLQQKIDQCGELDVKTILRIGMQTTAGLAAAHRQGLVHRDIKPSNILLENHIERVKLSDFGLARAVDDIGVTQTGQITGTPQYMSPEQAQAQRIDHRTDLFSLGCVLYAMCTGRAAFRADSAVAVMHRIVHEPPTPIREINDDIPDWMCEIVDKLLEKNPDDRFQSAEEVEALLAGHLAHLQQPESVQQPERLKPSRSDRGTQLSRELSDESLSPPISPQRRATNMLTTIGGLDVVVCLALFFGIAPGFRGREIPNVLAVSTVLGGLIGTVLLLSILIYRRRSANGALPRSIGSFGGVLALLPCGPVHILAIPVSIWSIHVFWHRPEAGRSPDSASAHPAVLPAGSAAKWPAVYLALIAVGLLSLALEGDSGFITRNWLNLKGRGRITLNVRDAGVRVTLNDAEQAVTGSGTVNVAVVPGVYVIRTNNRGDLLATYLHEIPRGFRVTQKINDLATGVAIIGPVSTEKLDHTARAKLLKKYSQPDAPPGASPRAE
jgi:serine/threonine protein kinase